MDRTFSVESSMIDESTSASCTVADEGTDEAWSMGGEFSSCFDVADAACCTIGSFILFCALTIMNGSCSVV